MRIVDSVALVVTVLLSLLFVSAAGVYTGTAAEIPPVPALSGSERRDAVDSQRRVIQGSAARAADIVTADSPLEAAPDESRGKPLALLILMLKEGRGTR